MSHDDVIDVDVLVAGGGPVGMTLAMELALHGVKALVLEARRETPANPRCNTTNARSMEVFRRFGCADAVRRAGLPAAHNTDVVYMTTMNGDTMLRYARPTTKQVLAGTPEGIGADWPTPEPQHFVSQLYMEPVLREHAIARLGVDLRAGWELRSFEQDNRGVTAIAHELSSGAEQRFRARYLVGADGSNSLVRRTIGARLEGIPRLGNAVTVFLRAPRLTELYRRAPGWMYRFLGGVVVVAIDGKDEWLVHTHPPEGVDPETFDFEPQIFEAIGERFEYEVINVARWTARAMVVNKFRDRRVFVAGDAAHLWIPMGGFGMNAGIGDGVALAWRLAGVVQGWLHEGMLDSYQAERQPMGSRVASQAARWGIELRPLMRPAPEVRAQLLRDAAARAALAERVRAVNTSEWQSVGMQLGYAYVDSPVIAYEGQEPPPFTVDAYRESSAPGARAPHVWREKPHADGRRRALFDDFGSGFTLLRIGAAAPAAQGLIRMAEQRGIPLTVLEVHEPEALRAYEGCGLVLVRPDQHIAWRGQADAADPQAVWDRVTGAATPVGVETRVAEAASANNAAVLGGSPGSVALALGADGHTVFVVDAGAQCVLHGRVEPGGRLSTLRVAFALAPGGQVSSLAADALGRLWVCRPDDRRVEGYDAADRLRWQIATPGFEPRHATARDDTLSVAGVTPQGQPCVAVVPLQSGFH